MHRILYIFILLTFISFFISGCSENTKKKAILEGIGKNFPYQFPKEDSCCRYMILRYVENPSCSSCQLKLGIWRVYYRKLKNKYGNQIGMHFIIRTNRVKETNHLLDMYGFYEKSSVDSIFDLYSILELDPILGSDITILLDDNNKIIGFGNPCEDIKIDSLFHQIFEKALLNQN